MLLLGRVSRNSQAQSLSLKAPLYVFRLFYFETFRGKIAKDINPLGIIMKLPVHSAFYARRNMAFILAAHMYTTIVEMMGKEPPPIKGVTKLNLSTFEIKTILAIIAGERTLSKLEGVTKNTNMGGVFAGLKRLGYKFTLSGSSDFANETIWDFTIDSEKLNLIDQYYDHITDKIPDMVMMLKGIDFNSCIEIGEK